MAVITSAARAQVPPTRVIRDPSAERRWELVCRAANPRLAGQVEGYQGYEERVGRPVVRRELPTRAVVLIINFGPAYRVYDGREPTVATEHRDGFVIGLHDAHAFSASTGAASCVQVNFTPMGARRILGVPMAELTGRVVRLADTLAPTDRHLRERLHAAPDWATRFAILDAVFARKLASAPVEPPEVTWAWEQLRRSGGGVDVATLAAELGWSRRHLAARFREHVGLPPKAVARLLRFRRAVALLEREGEVGGVSGAELALRCGYYDQAHLIRDFRQFAGVTPGEFLRHRAAPIDVGPGIDRLDEEDTRTRVPFVQDGA